MGIYERYKEVRLEVEDACEECGRPTDSVLLLAVSKTVGIDGVKEAIDAGAADFGENRPDQLMEKHAAFPEVNWHFIGNIQSRRIKDIVPCAYLIHSLYESRHARKIDEEAGKIGKVQKVLIEVNVSGEESKSGIDPSGLEGIVEECLSYGNIELCGLMTMAPQGDMDAARKTFEGLRSIFLETKERISRVNPTTAESFTQLSMGMSEDWRCAIEEGSTIVRIGRAIFSDVF